MNGLYTPQRIGFLQMNQYDLEDLHPTRIQHTDFGSSLKVKTHR